MYPTQNIFTRSAQLTPNLEILGTENCGLRVEKRDSPTTAHVKGRCSPTLCRFPPHITITLKRATYENSFYVGVVSIVA